MQEFSGNLIETLSRLAFPKIGIIDIIQIALIAFFVYQFMVWIKYTHAYTLLKGILVVLLFILIAYIFRMNTILWIFSNLASTLIVGVIVIFQPELRKVLEQLGQKRIMASLIPFDAGKEVKERFTDKTISELVKACFDMGEVKTGALIVIEQNELLTDYIRTGINLDAILTSQLLINIFEHNTPLHETRPMSLPKWKVLGHRSSVTRKQVHAIGRFPEQKASCIVSAVWKKVMKPALSLPNRKITKR